MKKSKHILAAVLLLVISFVISTLIFTLVVIANKGSDEDSEGLNSYLQDEVVVDRVTIGNDTFFIEAIDTETVAITGYEGSDVLHSVSIPDKLDDKLVVTISEQAFKDKTSITAISLPKTLEKIEDYAFAGCLGLKTVTIPANVTSIGEAAFARCYSLEMLVFANGTGLTEIAGKTFMDCKSLSQVSIPGEIQTIGEAAFMGCEGLTKITIGDGVKTIGSQAFMGCTALETLTVPASVETFETTAKNQPFAFANCPALYLDGITMPAGSAAENYFKNVLGLAQSAPTEE